MGNRNDNIALVEARIFRGDPFTFGELQHGIGNDWRDADRTIQKLRKKGLITFTRKGRECVWELTEAGVAAKAARDQGAL